AKLLMGHARMGETERLEPVVEGPRVAEALRVSLETHTILTRAFKDAREREPDGDGGQMARAAVAVARDHLGLIDQPGTGLPFFAVPTLPAYLRASARL